MCHWKTRQIRVMCHKIYLIYVRLAAQCTCRFFQDRESKCVQNLVLMGRPRLLVYNTCPSLQHDNVKDHCYMFLQHIALFDFISFIILLHLINFLPVILVIYQFSLVQCFCQQLLGLYW